MPPERPPHVRPWPAALLSLIVPGSGQFIVGHRSRGVGLFLTFFLLLALVLWTGTYALLAPLLLFLGWIARDAYQLAQGKQPRWGAALLLVGLVLYGAATVVTEVRPARLITGLPSLQPYIRSLFNPELFEYPTEETFGLTPVMVPCVDPLPEPNRAATTAPVVTTAAPCAAVGELLAVSGEGFQPNVAGQVQWVDPLGSPRRAMLDGELVTFVADADGRFQATLRVPQAVPLTSNPGPGDTLTHAVRAVQAIPSGSLQPTQTLSLSWRRSARRWLWPSCPLCWASSSPCRSASWRRAT